MPGAGCGALPGAAHHPVAAGPLGGEARLYRAMFLEEIGKDYVRTARAKGLSEQVVLFRHVLRNALIPIITSAGAYLPYVFMGSLVFESFFGIPGLGSFVIEAIGRAGLRHRAHDGLPGLGAVHRQQRADRHRLHVGRPARAAVLRGRPWISSSSCCGPTWRCGCCSRRIAAYGRACARHAAPARHLAPKVLRDPAALCSALVLLLFWASRCSTACTSAARCLPVPGQAAGKVFYDTRTESPARPGAGAADRHARDHLLGAAGLRGHHQAVRRTRWPDGARTPAPDPRRRAPAGPGAQWAADL
jgi:hypothetical protein